MNYINVFLSFLFGFAASVVILYCCLKSVFKIVTLERDNKRKMKEFYNLLIAWVGMKQRRVGLSSVLMDKGFLTVAIYGMKELGELLVSELDDSEVEIKYVIDRNKDMVKSAYPVFQLEEGLPDVDVIIVTAIHYYPDIVIALKDRVSCPIVSLEDLIYEQ